MENKLCISSRVRIARNIKGFPFRDMLAKSQALGIIDEVRGALGNEYSYINFSHLSQSKKNVYVEQHLVSHEFAVSERERALFLSADRRISVMIGEEDHIRIQAFAEGMNLQKALCEAQKVEDKLSEHIEFMFDERYGYITKCPTNIGTGIRASVLMFLPTIMNRNHSRSVIGMLSGRGMTVRGLFGEGSSEFGALYQISNNVTLGVTEDEIIKNVEETVSELEQAETTMQRSLIEANPDFYTDDCMRALGILGSAYIMSSSEACTLISKLMLGSTAGIINCEKSSIQLYNILMSLLPFTLTENFSNEIKSAEERDKYRAEYLRQLFKPK